MSKKIHTQVTGIRQGIIDKTVTTIFYEECYFEYDKQTIQINISGIINKLGVCEFPYIHVGSVSKFLIGITHKYQKSYYLVHYPEDNLY